MSEKAKRIIDLTQVRVKGIDGKEQVVDLSKELASAYYNKTQSLEEMSSCIDLFKTGKCEYSDAVKNGFILLMDELKTGYPVRQAVLEAIG